MNRPQAHRRSGTEKSVMVRQKNKYRLVLLLPATSKQVNQGVKEMG